MATPKGRTRFDRPECPQEIVGTRPLILIMLFALTACGANAREEAKDQIVSAGARAKCELSWTRENMASFRADCVQRVADEIERVYGPPNGDEALTTTQGITSLRLFWNTSNRVQVRFTPYYSDRDHGAIEILEP
jgi:hypothetical protein